MAVDTIKTVLLGDVIGVYIDFLANEMNIPRNKISISPKDFEALLKAGEFRLVIKE